MARCESDREDLFLELRTCCPRWEICMLGEEQPIVMGRRPDGRMSIYFGPDPCFHFDSQRRLLRSYHEGFLYRTQGVTLARLFRRRTESETVLARQDLTQQQLQEFLQLLSQRLQRFYESYRRGEWTILRQEIRLEGDLEEFMEQLAGGSAGPLTLAPAYPTRRK